MNRATKAQTEDRVNDLLRIILDGAEPWDLCEFVREKEQEEGSNWHLADGQKPLSYSQIRRYRAKAEEQIGDSCRASRKRLLRRHLAQRRNLYAKAVSQGDVRAALACIHDEAELQKLYEAPANIGKTEPIETPQDIRRVVAGTIGDLRSGQIDNKTASTIGALAGNLLRSMETIELEKRLTELEAHLQARRGK